MPRVPIHRHTKKELDWMSKNSCRHNHSYLEHYNCYLTEVVERDHTIGFFDIETSNLKANYGIMFGYAIKTHNKDEIRKSWITEKDLRSGIYDKKVVQDCIDDLMKYDRIVTYFGTRFDLPFVRTRAAVHNLDFPLFGQILHKDLYYLIRSKFQLHSNRLDVACETILGDSLKTRINPTIWMQAMQGGKDALDYIEDHCDKDVIDLERLYDATIIYQKDEDRPA
jgi:uncharacterized protein YprB with RNaseH-like and TPR domain